jgi:integrase
MRIYQRDETWYIDFSHDGKRIRKRVGSKRDAKNALAAVKVDILRGEYRFTKDKKILFKNFAKEYLEYAKVNKRSWHRDEVILRNNFLPFFGEMLLSKITPRHVDEYKKLRLQNKKSPGTINRELTCLKHMFTIAEKFRRFEGKNPVKQMKFLQYRQYGMKALNRDEIKRLIDASSGYLREMIILALNTGMRKNEIFSLKWKDVDFAADYIYVKETKSNVMRKIQMNSVVRSMLKRTKRESDFVFTNPKTGKQFTGTLQSFYTAREKAGVPDVRFHDLRHTSATLMIMGGVDLVTVSQILGHSDIKMTMRYAHPTPENKRKAVSVLTSAFEPKQEAKHGTNVAQESVVTDATYLLSDSKN